MSESQSSAPIGSTFQSCFDLFLDKSLDINLEKEKISSSLNSIDKGYVVKRKQKYLLVRQARDKQKVHLLAQRDKKFLVEWLQLCSAFAVIIDPELGYTQILNWVDTCHKHGKPIYIQIPSNQYISKYHHSLSWHIKRLCDWIIAAILLIFISPVLLTIVLVNYFKFNQRAFTTQWCVGKRGQLFRLYKFDNAYPTQQYINKLPQLFNVLQGQMSLFGKQPVTLIQSLQTHSAQRQFLNDVPGIF